MTLFVFKVRRGREGKRENPRREKYRRRFTESFLCNLLHVYIEEERGGVASENLGRNATGTSPHSFDYIYTLDTYE